MTGMTDGSHLRAYFASACPAAVARGLSLFIHSQAPPFLRSPQPYGAHLAYSLSGMYVGIWERFERLSTRRLRPSCGQLHWLL